MFRTVRQYKRPDTYKEFKAQLEKLHKIFVKDIIKRVGKQWITFMKEQLQHAIQIVSKDDALNCPAQLVYLESLKERSEIC